MKLIVLYTNGDTKTFECLSFHWLPCGVVDSVIKVDGEFQILSGSPQDIEKIEIQRK